jgi:hypothetical protein
MKNIQKLHELKAFYELLKSNQPSTATVTNCGPLFSDVFFLKEPFIDFFDYLIFSGSFTNRFALVFTLLPAQTEKQLKHFLKELYASKNETWAEKKLKRPTKEVQSTKKALFEALWNSDTLKTKITSPNNSLTNYYDSPLHVQCAQVSKLANELFSLSFLETNNLLELKLLAEVEKRMKHYEVCAEEERSSYRHNQLIIRFEEIRDEFRVILLLDVLTMRVELTYANKEEKGVLNPLTKFVDFHFAYEKYFNFRKQNDFLFLETQGASQYPLAHNNVQELRLTFSVVNDYATIFDIWAKSARKQGIWLKRLLGCMHMFCFLSDEGKRIEIAPSECTKLPFSNLPAYSGKSNPTSYSGFRTYTSGLWCIQIHFDTQEELDDFGNAFNVNFLSARVEPFCQNQIQGEGARYYHPFIYDWEK